MEPIAISILLEEIVKLADAIVAVPILTVVVPAAKPAPVTIIVEPFVTRQGATLVIVGCAKTLIVDKRSVKKSIFFKR